jgi:hypothetical protein
MISKGDLVHVRLSAGGESEKGRIRDVIILGKITNYCEDEDTYILAPEVISIPKEQVSAIEQLPEDFDFTDVMSEMSQTHEKTKREKPSEIENIRFSRKD